MNKDFELLLNCVGIGDPKNSIWFVGIEEAAEINPNAENYKNIIDKCRQNNIYVEPNEILNDHKKIGKKYTKIYNYMSVLVMELFESEKKIFKDHMDYRNNKLLQKDSQVFLTELYPLGKKSIKKKHQYLHKFGIKNYADYINIVKNERFEIVYDCWLKSKPILTICFGKSHWNDFKMLYKLNDEQSKLILKSKFSIHKDKKIVLSPFFGIGAISYNNIIQLARIIKEKQMFS